MTTSSAILRMFGSSSLVLQGKFWWDMQQATKQTSGPFFYVLVATSVCIDLDICMLQNDGHYPPLINLNIFTFFEPSL